MGKTNIHVNLDHHIPSESLFTKCEYDKIGKSEEAKLHQKSNLDYRDFLEDNSGLTIWDRLRKPEFQRPTFCWEDDKYINLLKALQNNRVIPGVIFWLNTSTGHIFVLDGAHRLSAIRAWFTNDWGDSSSAQEYNYLEEDEKSASQRLRESISSEIGSFENCVKAGKLYRNAVDNRKDPFDTMDEATAIRGKFFYNLSTSLTIPIQWVVGDYKVAEESFLNINTGGTPLESQEVDFLKYRRSPVARAITGIIANGYKESVWIDNIVECNEISKRCYNLLLSDSDNHVNESITYMPFVKLQRKNGFYKHAFLLNLLAISSHKKTGDNTLFTTLSNLSDEANEIIVSQKTFDTLKNLESTMNHIRGKLSQSVGLYPPLYFYSSDGKYREQMLLMFLAWFSRGSDTDIKKRKYTFTLYRSQFEECWSIARDYIFYAMNRKGIGPRRLTDKSIDLLDEFLDTLVSGVKSKKGLTSIIKDFLKDYHEPTYISFCTYLENIGEKSKPFSSLTKNKIEIKNFIEAQVKCEICGGYVDLGNSHQVDHIHERSMGGTNDLNNGRITHPYCNNNRRILESITKINLEKIKQTNLNKKVNISEKNNKNEAKKSTPTTTQLSLDV
ncbi:hypothetical protein JOC95_000958 [Bacillus tianshenii]|uniref:HNH nuclease domain-containing protein n=1 Tax=Sutcliffiella tianshenii TaxID=1463404 RepID=A0ABS2NWR8_9BACI|nr:DUF262 domain-containing protein [Bacillus tianshenii]MBM7619109.1 hypothetical protein [Bacillus tianshenii]